ncbi:DUF2892 domain-containing protein [Polynucleobacter sp. HIN9]|nr:DUF2892 domain-containing protein [Polynucleobacter sp. HIN7]BEI40720.1 DUF2892 domain-containing protein [Polynucleobacter sp. HIN9]
MMQCNVGHTDRVLRISAGSLLILLSLSGVIGAWGWIGVVPLATGIFRFCPAYPLLGMNTAKKK